MYPENHPLNLTFNQDGLCSGCVVHEEKDEIDWGEKENDLKSLLNSYRSKSHGYDCIVPVSGARDSYFIVDQIKNKYGMNPLLVSYNKHYNTDIGIKNLAYLRSYFDCDFLMQTVSPDVVKNITRVTLRDMGSIYWHCIAGQTVFPVQCAVRYKVPLIIWGAHQGIDQVGMFSHHDNVEMTRKYRKEHDLMGFEAEDIVDTILGITEKDVQPFVYPNDIDLEKVGVRGIYLNNYHRWDSKQQHENMIDKYSYKSQLQTRTFDTYNDIDCFHYSNLHDHIKYIKYGYGKITDHVSREIRLKRLSREEGAVLVKRYTNKKPEYNKLFLDWIGIKESGLNYLLDKHRNPTAWHKGCDNEWIINDSIINYIPDGYSNNKNIDFDCGFRITEPRMKTLNDRYTLIGRGYEDE